MVGCLVHVVFARGGWGVCYFFAAMGWGKELNNCLFNIYKRGFSGDKLLELFFLVAGRRGGLFLLQWCGTMYGLFFRGFSVVFVVLSTQVLYLVGGYGAWLWLCLCLCLCFS